MPGVGPKLAEAILDHRRLHGPFRSVDELKNVRGVGPVTFERIRSQFRAAASAIADRLRLLLLRQPQSAGAGSAPAVGRLRVEEDSAGRTADQREHRDRGRTTAPARHRPGDNTQNIIASRTVSPFQSIDDMGKVKGIGPKTLEKLRPFAAVK